MTRLPVCYFLLLITPFCRLQQIGFDEFPYLVVEERAVDDAKNVTTTTVSVSEDEDESGATEEGAAEVGSWISNNWYWVAAICAVLLLAILGLLFYCYFTRKPRATPPKPKKEVVIVQSTDGEDRPEIVVRKNSDPTGGPLSSKPGLNVLQPVDARSAKALIAPSNPVGEYVKPKFGDGSTVTLPPRFPDPQFKNSHPSLLAAPGMQAVASAQSASVKSNPPRTPSLPQKKSGVSSPGSAPKPLSPAAVVVVNPTQKVKSLPK